MVLESILDPLKAERRPDEMLLYGFIVATIAILLSLWVFPSYASFAMVTFTVMAVLPLMVKIMQVEKERKKKTGWHSLLTHRSAATFFIFLFAGFVLAYAFWFLLLPSTATNKLFFLQINTIAELSPLTGSAIGIQNAFTSILVNNFRILGLTVLFSFILGSGAIFILAWNASVLAVAIANTVKISIAAGSGGAAGYFAAFAFSLLRYSLHGIPEIMAYFLGGLAGGIVSFAILDYKRGSKTFLRSFPISLKDAGILVSIAAVLLLFATGVEVFITPALIQ